MEFNNKEFNIFREDIIIALQGVAAKHKLAITMGNITYNNYEFSAKLTCAKKDENNDIEKIKFEDDCRLYGFEKEQYKAKFILQGKEFELVGFNDRSPKNNCSIKSLVDGKVYKCNDETVKRALKK